jgi:hypothetical protein
MQPSYHFSHPEKEAESLRRRLAKGEPVRLELAACLWQLAEEAHGKKQLDSLALAQEALALCMVAAHADDEGRRYLAEAYCVLAWAREWPKKPSPVHDELLKLYDQALGCLGSIESPSRDDLLEIGHIHAERAVRLRTIGRLTEAIAAKRRQATLYREAGDREIQGHFIGVAEELAEYQQAAGDPVAASASLAEAVACADTLARAPAGLLRKQARALILADNLLAALEAAERAVATESGAVSASPERRQAFLQEVAASLAGDPRNQPKAPDDPRSPADIAHSQAESLMLLAEIRQRLGQLEEAAEAISAAAATLLPHAPARWKKWQDTFAALLDRTDKIAAVLGRSPLAAEAEAQLRQLYARAGGKKE